MKQKSADEIRQEKLIEDIRKETAHIKFPSDEELERFRLKREEENKKIENKAVAKNGFFAMLRTIICTPLSIAFHAISFVSKGIGYISSFGLLIGFYYLYQSFSALFKGVAFAEIETFGKSVPFLIFPFIAYGISVVTEKVWLYLESQSA